MYNNVVKEIENKKKEKAERLEDGEITDSDEEDENRTPTLSPTPPPEHNSLRSDRKKYSSPSSKHTKKNDLRNVLKDKERKKNTDSNRSNSKSDRKASNRSKDRDYGRSHSCHSRERRSRSRSGNLIYFFHNISKDLNEKLTNLKMMIQKYSKLKHFNFNR